MKFYVETTQVTLRNRAGITAAGGVRVDINYDTPRDIYAETRENIDRVIENAKKVIEDGIHQI